MNDEEILVWMKRLTRALEERTYAERMERSHKDRAYLPKHYPTTKSQSLPMPYVLNKIMEQLWRKRELSESEAKMLLDLYGSFYLAS